MSNNTDQYNFQASFQGAKVFLPEARDKRSPSRGPMSEMIGALRNAQQDVFRYPVAIFMQGSRYVEDEYRLAEWLVDRVGLILIAPATHEISNRPGYESPAAPETYQAVHVFRRAELAYVIDQLTELDVIDTDKLILIGNSEGAVAAGTWPGNAGIRILLAWSCEQNYFCEDPVLAGNRKTTNVLNIIGSNDPYFGARKSLSADQGVLGHGAKALSDFADSKVIIYPGWGHRVLDNPHSQYDIASFLKRCREVL